MASEKEIQMLLYFRPFRQGQVYQLRVRWLQESTPTHKPTMVNAILEFRNSLDVKGK